MTGRERIEGALGRPQAEDRLALVPFLTAGYPSREGFADLLVRAASRADAIEVGLPFSDPVADGVTIQRSSRAALEAGVSVAWTLDLLRSTAGRLAAPVVIMSYLNPLLAHGLDRFGREAAAAGVSGAIVPDLPWEERGPVAAALSPRGIALVQLVTPATPPARLARLCAASQGCVYAVTVTGTTGGRAGVDEALARHLWRVRESSRVPVLAGFGIRDVEQMAALRGLADGAVVGSALLDRLARGEDPEPFLIALRNAGAAAPRAS